MATLAYRIVINCTTAESVLKLVSTLRLACSSHSQEKNKLYLASRYTHANQIYIDTSPCNASKSYIHLSNCKPTFHKIFVCLEEGERFTGARA